MELIKVKLPSGKILEGVYQHSPSPWIKLESKDGFFIYLTHDVQLISEVNNKKEENGNN